MSTTLAPATDRDKRQQAINRSLDRAHDAARAGSVPVLTETSFDGRAIRETWNVESRSGRGVYAVSLTRAADGIRTVCTCPATGACWHRAAARLASDDVIASRNEAGLRFRRRVVR